MSIDNVKAYFKEIAPEKRILEFDSSSATVQLAAQVLGCEEARIAKTLSFDIDGRTILIVTAGDMRLDNAKYKLKFSKKAKMLAFSEVPERVGHAVGGVCPFAVKENVEIYLDKSLQRFQTVFPACGSSSSAIELTPKELEQYSRSIEWIDVCKNMV